LVAISSDTLVAVTKRRVHRFDLASNELRSSPVLPAEEGFTAVIDWEVDAARAAIALVRTDGKRELRSFETFEPLVDPADSMVVSVNTGIYAPLVLSTALAYSPDGRLFAALDPDGMLVLEDLEKRAHKMSIPPRPLPEGAFGELAEEPAIAAAFSPDSRLLAVIYEHGFALYGCEARRTELEEGAIPVRIDGPTRINLGEEATWVATDLLGGDLHGHRFFVDGAPIGEPSEVREFLWSPSGAGTFTIRVELDDGIKRGAAELRLEVLP
jgi:hypothetical protein